MNLAAHDMEQLIGEHHALMRYYGQAQWRCSELVRAQAAEIESLRAQAMRLRAAVIVRDTALAWAQEHRVALQATIPGLPKRVTLARHIDALLARIQDLMRERLQWKGREAPEQQAAMGALPSAERGQPADQAEDGGQVEDLAGLEASLVAADLVICQTGCLSHGAYWRVQDHCKRTGKACVLVEQPDAVRIVRIHKPPIRSSTAEAASTQKRALP